MIQFDEHIFQPGLVQPPTSSVIDANFLKSWLLLMSALPCFYHFTGQKELLAKLLPDVGWTSTPKMQDKIVMFLVDTGIMGGWSNIHPENHHPSTNHNSPPKTSTFFYTISWFLYIVLLQHLSALFSATSWGNQSTYCKIIQVYQLRNAILENSTATTKKDPRNKKQTFGHPTPWVLESHFPTGTAKTQVGWFLYGRNILWCFNWEEATQHLGDVRLQRWWWQ